MTAAQIPLGLTERDVIEGGKKLARSLAWEQKPTLPQRAIIGVRISDDKAGDALGVARQETDGRRLAEQLGWGVLEVVVENDTSAYKRKRIRTPSGRMELRTIRPGYRHIIEMLETGQADGYIAYDLDRSVRDPRDLEDLVDVVESKTPRVPVRSVTGSLRLDNDADITMARVMVAIANKSSRDTARRVARKHEELAQAGSYAGGGARRYGYARDGITLDAAEAEVLREVARRVLDGERVHAICADLDARGVKPVKAKRWSTKAMSDILRGGRVYGLRVFRGEISGPATWPAIIDPDLRPEILATLQRNSHGAGKAALRYWCNQLLWCGRCGEPLVGRWETNRKRSHSYWCHYMEPHHGCGRILINGPGVEAEVERQVLAYLGRADVVAALTAGAGRVAVAETKRLLTADEADLRALARAHGNRQISLAEWLEARAPIEARIKTYEAALKAALPGQVRAFLAANDHGAAWGSLTPESKRELVRVVLDSDGYKGWAIAPADPTKRRAFDAGRMSLISTDAIARSGHAGSGGRAHAK